MAKFVYRIMIKNDTEIEISKHDIASVTKSTIHTVDGHQVSINQLGKIHPLLHSMWYTAPTSFIDAKGQFMKQLDAHVDNYLARIDATKLAQHNLKNYREVDINYGIHR